MNLGVRAHDFGKLPIEELVRNITAKGFSCAQLALSKALAGIDTDSGRLSPGLARYIGESFDRAQIQIAVLGCYINPVHPDQEVRKKMLERFQEHLRFARDFGCSLVATETGSLNADYSFHSDNHSDQALQLFLDSLAQLVQEAEKFGVMVGIEGVTKHVVNTPGRMRQVLNAIPSNNLQVVFDPVNYLSAANYRNQDEIMKQSFELFGEKILIIHAKDFQIANGELHSVEAGRGSLNYELLLQLQTTHKPYLQILLEDTKPSTMDQSIRFIRQLADRVQSLK